MAGLVDDFFPSSRSSRRPIMGPTTPILDDHEEKSMKSKATLTSTPNLSGGGKDFPSGTPSDSVAEPTPEPSGEVNDKDEDRGDEDTEDANEGTQNEDDQIEQSSSVSPSLSSTDRMNPSRIPPTTLITSTLPLQIKTSYSVSSAESPVQASVDVEEPAILPSSETLLDEQDEDEKPIMAPPPMTSLPRPPQQITAADGLELIQSTLLTLSLVSSSSTAIRSRIDNGGESSIATSTETDHAAATALSAPPPDGDIPSGDGGLPSALMPALPISLGLAGGILVVAVLAGTLYRKKVWPFCERRRAREDFETMEAVVVAREMEKRQRMKWDPRVSGGWNGNAHF
ncbi:hypothetical protein ACRALDRAFT_1071274 [Sodiomyces alcalophilus JCM 7366]|uniref:uncharacterized protein n=1 Tax=Sodiomyces alcalophilus JCM 7366 TaxID=591952 RepID=UPI0039B68A0F